MARGLPVGSLFHSHINHLQFCMRGSRARLCDAPCARLHILGIYLCVCYSLYSDGVVYVFYSMVWYVVRYRIVRAKYVLGYT